MTATPFETAGGSAFTTLAAEAAFIDALMSANPSKVTKSILGQSVQARDIYSLTFGTGMGAPLLMLTTIHGDETLPREAALTLARDLCETEHPWASILADRKLILIPTPNPDGFQAQTRNNANDLDLNRHYVSYTSAAPETRLIVDLIHDLVPAATYDGHEWNGNPNADSFIGMANHSAVDREVRAAMIATGEHVAADLLAFGAADAGWYPRDSPEDSIQHLSALLGIPFFLMETCEALYGDPTLYQGRHDRQLVAMSSWLDWMSTHAATYESLGVAARARMGEKVTRGNYDWLIYHQSPVPPANWTSETAVAVTAQSYTATDIGAVSPILDAHGIPYNGTSGVVGLDHDRASLAAFICDLLGLGLGDCTRTVPVVTWSPQAASDPIHQLWPTP